MKLSAFIFLILFILISCTTSKKVTDGRSNLFNENDYKIGLELVSASDCFVCHKIAEKNIGPAWQDVAAKYTGQDTAVQYLAKKIINGGAGVWGEIPMIPHPALTRADAESIAKYVLLLKN